MFLIGCSNPTSYHEVLDLNNLTTDRFLDMLREIDVEFEELPRIEIEDSWMTVVPHQILINGEHINIYEYFTHEEMLTHASFVDGHGSGISNSVSGVNVQVSFNGNPYWFKGGNIIVFFVESFNELDRYVLNSLMYIFHCPFAGFIEEHGCTRHNEIGSFSFAEVISDSEAEWWLENNSDFYNVDESIINNAREAISLALNEVQVEYNNIIVYYDIHTSMWKVVFLPNAINADPDYFVLGGSQTVFLSNDGITKLIIFGE